MLADRIDTIADLFIGMMVIWLLFALYINGWTESCAWGMMLMEDRTGSMERERSCSLLIIELFGLV